MKKINPATTVFLIDGSSFLYRAYYGLKPMHTSDGVQIQAVFGFCRMIKKLITDFHPQRCALVWDSRGKTVRHEMYEEYKATRQAAPSDLGTQKMLIQEFAQAIGLVQVQQDGIEADDLMYSLARDCAKDGITAVFVTSDKDMGQAVTEDIVMFDPFKDAILTPVELHQKYGFPPEKLVFYFSLIGDASDNIPGVAGIGPKGALDLVTQFASLGDLYDNLDKVSKSRMRELLEKSRENAFLSEKLFQLQYIPLSLTCADLAFDKEHWKDALEFFKKLNFKSLIKDLEAPLERAEPLEKKYNFITVTTHEQLAEVVDNIKRAGHVAIDTECSSFNALQSVLVGISLCVEHGTAYYIPVGHRTNEAQLELELVKNALQPLFEDVTIKKILQHAKFDMHVLSTVGLRLKGIVFDTMIAAFLTTRDSERIGLKALSERFLDEEMLAFTDVVKMFGVKDFAYVPLTSATAYAAADAHQTLALWQPLQEELVNNDQVKLFEDIEMPLIDILFAMEQEGIILDTAVLTEINTHISAELETLKNNIIDLSGISGAGFNLNSPQQIASLLFEVLKLPPIKKTKTGYSTDQEVLLELAKQHPVPGLIVQYRELFKLKSTYVEALPTYVNHKTGRIHTTFSQTSAATGRLASSEPNLQNIPATAIFDDISIRSAFKAPEGHVFLSADYSQIELRVLAYLSQDPALLSAFTHGEDIHLRTAAGLFDVELSAVTKEQRQLAKRINFSILYGLTPFGLSKDLGISMSDAKKYIDKYFAQFPAVVNWMESVIEETQRYGYVTTHWGRRRYIPGIYEKNKTLYDLARRVAINTKAQGTAADLMKIGMIKVRELLKKTEYGATMILQIHDELLFTVPKEFAEQAAASLAKTLSDVVQWNVPLEVNTTVGDTWHAASK